MGRREEYRLLGPIQAVQIRALAALAIAREHAVSAFNRMLKKAF
jgi:hypothetical protein